MHWGLNLGRRVTQASSVLKGGWAGPGKHQLTVVIVLRHPPLSLGQTNRIPQALALFRGVLEALFDLDPFAGPNGLPHDDDIVLRRVKCLVAAALRIVDVLTDDLPVVYIERLLSQDLIGVPQPVEEKSGRFSKELNLPSKDTRGRDGLGLTDV